MPGLVPGIHAGMQERSVSETGAPVCRPLCGCAAWMAGTSPAMTSSLFKQANPEYPPPLVRLFPSPAKTPGGPMPIARAFAAPAAIALLALTIGSALAQQKDMSFFI